MHFKGALQVPFQLHSFLQLAMHKNVQKNSIKSETEEALYAALLSASKISF